MKYLLDTQILIWWIEGSNRLSKGIKDLIESDNIKYVSVASFWEMVIKKQIGKLKLGKSLNFILQNLDFDILDIKLEHILKLDGLKRIHKDPFDRIIISQAFEEKCILLTSDKTVKKYFN